MLDPIKRLIDNIRNWGLEYYSRYYGVYRGIVYDNNDPDRRGRLILKVPSLWGDDTHNEWVYPKGIYSGNKVGFFAVPQVGDGVWVCFENGDVKHPVWTYGWWAKDDMPDRVLEDYPNVQVWQSGANRIELDETAGLFRVVTKEGTTIEVNPDGVSLGTAGESAHPAAHGDTTADLLEQLIQLLIDARTPTQLGPQPLVNIQAKLSQLKGEVSSLISDKVTLD